MANNWSSTGPLSAENGLRMEPVVMFWNYEHSPSYEVPDPAAIRYRIELSSPWQVSTSFALARRDVSASSFRNWLTTKRLRDSLGRVCPSEDDAADHAASGAAPASDRPVQSDLACAGRVEAAHCLSGSERERIRRSEAGALPSTSLLPHAGRPLFEADSPPSAPPPHRPIDG